MVEGASLRLGAGEVGDIKPLDSCMITVLLDPPITMKGNVTGGDCVVQCRSQFNSLDSCFLIQCFLIP